FRPDEVSAARQRPLLTHPRDRNGTRRRRPTPQRLSTAASDDRYELAPRSTEPDSTDDARIRLVFPLARRNPAQQPPAGPTRRSALDVARDRGGELVDLLGAVAGPDGVGDAVVDVVLQQQQRHALQRRLDRADLGQHVDAVAVFVDHLLEPADLPG